MACRIKTIYCVRDFFTNENETTVTKCPCHQPLTLLFYTLEWHFSRKNNYFPISTLEKQLNWRIKPCFNRYKMDSAHDLGIHYRILSVRHLLDLKAVLFFWKWKYNLSPAFSRLQIATANLKTIKEH